MLLDRNCEDGDNTSPYGFTIFHRLKAYSLGLSLKNLIADLHSSITSSKFGLSFLVMIAK